MTMIQQPFPFVVEDDDDVEINVEEYFQAKEKEEEDEKKLKKEEEEEKKLKKEEEEEKKLKKEEEEKKLKKEEEEKKLKKEEEEKKLKKEEIAKPSISALMVVEHRSKIAAAVAKKDLEAILELHTGIWRVRGRVEPCVIQMFDDLFQAKAFLDLLILEPLRIVCQKILYTYARFLRKDSDLLAALIDNDDIDLLEAFLACGEKGEKESGKRKVPNPTLKYLHLQPQWSPLDHARSVKMIEHLLRRDKKIHLHGLVTKANIVHMPVLFPFEVHIREKRYDCALFLLKKSALSAKLSAFSLPRYLVFHWLSCATQGNSDAVEVTQILLKNGGGGPSLLTWKDENNYTALHTVTNSEILKVFLSVEGVSLNQMGGAFSSMKSPLETVKDEECKRILVAAGASKAAGGKERDICVSGAPKKWETLMQQPSPIETVPSFYHSAVNQKCQISGLEEMSGDILDTIKGAIGTKTTCLGSAFCGSAIPLFKGMCVSANANSYLWSLYATRAAWIRSRFLISSFHSLLITGPSSLFSYPPLIRGPFALTERMKAVNEGKILEPLDPTINEVRLWHGTTFAAAQQIMENGFDLRVSSAPGLYGNGIYFAEDACKSLQYSQDPNIKVLLLCRVILGNPYFVKSTDQRMYEWKRPPTYTLPSSKPILHDSVIANSGVANGKTQVHSEFIVYENMQAFPEFMVLLQK